MEVTPPPDPNFSAVGYLLYAPDGRIESYGQCTAGDFQHQERSGLTLLQVEPGNYAESYVDLAGEPRVLDRPAMALTVSKLVIEADGVDSTLITGIPPIATVTMNDGAATAVDDGELEVSSAVAEEIEILISAFPFLRGRVSIRVTL